MIAPFLFKKIKDKILITNDFGRYMFLNKDEFSMFLSENLNETSNLYKELEKNFFVFNTSIEEFINSTKYHLRASKDYLFSATSLHIFVVTNYCNSKCIYCQAQSNSNNSAKKMNIEVARRSVDIALQSPQKELNFEFQGGEPLSNFEVIKYIIEYTEEKKADKIIRYSIVSNLTLLTSEIIEFCSKYDVVISTSLDGNLELHNMNRPLLNTGDSYSIVSESIDMLKKNNIHCGAIQTTTKYSLTKYKEIIDEYITNGFQSVFIRPLTPLGYALEKWNEIGYSSDQFLDFYKKCLLYIIEKNKEGHFIQEGHATIFLSKILHGFGANYMELRSPCGAGIGQMAYYYDGDIYLCDEARMLGEMGDNSFCVGNVFENNYDSLIESKVCKATCKYSILEALPQCTDCSYMPYCGTCPVINYALENDIISRSTNSYRCDMYKGMLDIIFELLLQDENKGILEKWK